MPDPISIQSEADLDAAIAEIDTLLILDRTPEQDARLDAVTDAVEAYEDEHYPTNDVSQGEMLQFLIESARATTAAKVSRATGIGEADLEAVLAGSALFTPEQLATASAYFHVDPAVFLPDEPKGS